MRRHISTLVGYTAYSNDGCRCDDCRGAWTDYCRAGVEARVARPDLYPVPHGTRNGYMNYRCRCDECGRANTEYMRERRRAAKERAS